MEMPEPLSVAEGFIIAMNNHNLSAALDSFTDNAIVRIDPPPPPPDHEVIGGKDEIRAWLSQLIAEGFHSTPRNFDVRDSTVYWVADIHAERYRSRGVEHTEVINEAAVEGDRIKSLIITFAPEIMDRLWARASAAAEA